MLLRLALEQFVIIESAVLEFGPGINVLTGEAGAGKSILVDALGLVTGERASSDWVRAGAERLGVEAAFDLAGDAPALAALAAAGIPCDEDCLLLLRREVGADGRSRAFANGRQVLVSQLREWTANRVRIVGQGEQRALLASGQQEDLLDRVAQTESLALKYRSLRRSYLERGRELEELERSHEAHTLEAEWLRFQVEEIDSVDPRVGERAELRDLQARSRDREETAERSRTFRTQLTEDDGSIADHLESLLHSLRRAEGPLWNEVNQRLLSMRVLVREIERLLPGDDEEVEFDSDAVEARLQTIDRLVRKYGDDEESVRRQRDRAALRLLEGEALASRMESAAQARRELGSQIFSCGQTLSEARRGAAERLGQGVASVLAGLGMPAAELRFEFRREESDGDVRAEPALPGVRALEGGLDHIAPKFRSHGSLEWGDLGRVASGGELSRVLLALHSAAGEAAMPGTWVFDEIDAGIGGETAVRVADRLQSLAQRTQVLLVTHLPVIAARAERHFRVTKGEHRKRPRAVVERLDEEARLGELARMLSGDDRSEVARRHASELRAGAGGGVA